MAIRILTIFAVLFFSSFTFAGEPGREPARAPAAAAPADHYNLFGDALVWTATEDGLGFVVRCPGVPLGGGPTNGMIATDCDTVDLEPDWQAGFRVGGGYTWSPDLWDLQVRWTWFKTNDSKALTGGTFYPTWTHPDVAVAAGLDVSAVAFWYLKFNSIDLEMGKTFKPGTFFTLRPHAGVKGAIIDQDFDARYQNSTLVNSTLNRHVIMSNDFGGVGFRGGFDAYWDLNWYGFSLFGKGSGSILFGEFKTHFLNRADSSTYAHVRDSFNTTKGVLEGALGVNMHTTDLLGTEYPLDFYAMWEDQLFFSQNQIMRFMGDTTDDGKFIHEKGDLGFHGITFGIQVAFTI